MNYQKHYNLLIARAKTRTLETYTERHHVVPKCMGGSNRKDNLVRLTPEEHYVAHQLLVKIYPGVNKLVYAAMCMSTLGNNKKFGWIKKSHSKMMSNLKTGSGNHFYGKKHSEAALLKMRTPRTNTENMKKPTGETNFNFGKKRSEESKQKMRKPKPAGFGEARLGKGNTNYGKHFSEQSKQKMRDRALTRPKPICPHCNTIAMGIQIRNHYDNCKHLMRVS